MRAESIQDLQAEIFRKVHGFQELPSVAATWLANGLNPSPIAGLVDPALLDPMRPRPPRRSDPRVQEDVALGTARGRSDNDVRLAVLVQSEDLMQSDAIDQIRRIARDECEVTYIGPQEAAWTKMRQRPMKMGSSVAPAPYDKRGTLGFFARNAAGKVVMVSNNHVLAGINRFPVGTRVLQQASKDGGKEPADLVGTLSNYIPLLFSGMPNAVDAACAEVDAGIDFDATTMYRTAHPPVGVGTVDFSSIAVAQPGMEVIKTGRTTGHTKGRVTAVGVQNYAVKMSDRLGKAMFHDQIKIQPPVGARRRFSRPGDSGSLVCATNGKPVALLFAGSLAGGEEGIGVAGVTPIATVMAQLGLSFL